MANIDEAAPAGRRQTGRRKKASPEAAPVEAGPAPVTESAAVTATKAAAEPPLEASLDRYTVEKIHRTQAKGAAYNPRFMPEANRRKLREGIESLGNLGPIIWNRRTGNIVGGHQRISVFDDYYQTQNYTLRVAAVDLDDKQEREANVLLNNPKAQGEFDFEKLGDLFKEDLSPKAAGFDDGDVFKLFGADAFNDKNGGGERLLKLGDKLAENRERIQREVEQTSAHRDDTQFFLVFVFRDSRELDGVLGRHQLPNDQWQSGDELRVRLERLEELEAEVQRLRVKCGEAEPEPEPEDAAPDDTGDDGDQGEADEDE